MAAIDPHTVPPFPVYTLLLNEHTQRIELDGMPLEPSVGQDYKQAGIQAIIRKASVQNLDAVRVNVHNHEGDRWSMVVTQDGNVYDTTLPRKKKPSQPTTAHTIGGAAAADCRCRGTVAAMALPSADEESQWTTWELKPVPRALPQNLNPTRRGRYP